MIALVIARRFLDYRRAEWLTEQPDDLEQRLRSVWRLLPEATQRVTQRRDGTSVMGFSLEDHDAAGISIHCVRYTDGQGVGIIPMAPGPGNLGEKLPEDAENWIETSLCWFSRTMSSLSTLLVVARWRERLLRTS